MMINLYTYIKHIYQVLHKFINYLKRFSFRNKVSNIVVSLSRDNGNKRQLAATMAGTREKASMHHGMTSCLPHDLHPPRGRLLFCGVDRHDAWATILLFFVIASLLSPLMFCSRISLLAGLVPGSPSFGRTSDFFLCFLDWHDFFFACVSSFGESHHTFGQYQNAF